MRNIKIYTDGSHLKGTSKVTYGICLVEGEVERTHSGIIDTDYFLKVYGEEVSNPTAELYAAAKAMNLIQNIKDANLIVYSDYKGVQEWINGNWKAKKPYIKDILAHTLEYINIFASNGSNVIFEHVPGHSGYKYNEVADQLCRLPAHCQIKPYLNDKELQKDLQ
jgi:ribonuclease H-related protein